MRRDRLIQWPVFLHDMSFDLKVYTKGNIVKKQL